MLKHLTAIFLLFAALLSAAPAEKLTAEWDFAKSATATTDGKLAGAVFRGETTVKDGWLNIPITFADKAQGLVTNPRKIFPELSPSGGFRIEAVAKLHDLKDATTTVTLMLFDNKYLFYPPKIKPEDANHGFAFGLTRYTNGLFCPFAYIGFPYGSISLKGYSIALNPEQEYTFAMEYNGTSRVSFFIDGKLNHSISIKGGPIAPAIRPAVIGDRCGSTHNPFNGQIKSIRLYTFPPQVLSFSKIGRSAFLRSEKNANINFKVLNSADKKINDVSITIKYQTTGAKTKLKIGDIKPGETKTASLPVETRLLPTTYQCTAELWQAGIVEPVDSLVFDFNIAPCLPPDYMPVVMWGGGDIDTMRDCGFTSSLEGFDEQLRLSSDKEATIQYFMNRLDKILAKGFRHTGYFTLAHSKDLKEKFPRYTRDGTPVVKNIEASNPEYQKIITDAAAETAAAIANHPASTSLLINSEVRDSTMPSFNKAEPAAFQKAAGYPIPECISLKGGVPYSKVPGFPISRIVPDDHPILTYYRWFWKNGDGWNVVHSKVSTEYHKAIKRPFWSFFDPAVRVPPIWGSGGTVDYLSHWTYAYPEPFRAALVTDELRTMAKGCPGQGVMTMTQIICYRSATAPIGIQPDNEPEWVKDSPKGPYISIPPDCLQAAIWSMISREVSGIMFHGSQSLWGKPGNKGYVMTNPDTAIRLSKVLNSVVKPLGPTLKRIPERKPQVAILQSFTSSVFAGRGTWGWTSWLFDANIILHRAQLSPAVFYEETINRDSLDGLKVLCLFHCDALQQSTFQKIIDFQRKGGIIVADEFLTPAIMPDIVLQSLRLSPNAQTAKKQIQDAATELRKQLDPVFLPYADSDNVDLLTHVRSFKDADYLFVLNDKRTYGDYLGPWKLVMEKGLPNSGHVTLKRSAKAVYDLVTSKPVPFNKTDDGISIPLDFTTNDGRLLLVLDAPIASVQCSVKHTAKLGEPLTVTATVKSDGLFFNSATKALIPVNITLADPDGHHLDGSGQACAVNGIISCNFTTPLNAKPGLWSVTVTEHASGKSYTKTFTLK